MIRALLFAGMDRAAVDERGFEAVRRIRQTQSDVPLSAFKATVREQFYMLLIDTEAALAAIPSMLPDDCGYRGKSVRFDLPGTDCARRTVGPRPESALNGSADYSTSTDNCLRPEIWPSHPTIGKATGKSVVIEIAVKARNAGRLDYAMRSERDSNTASAAPAGSCMRRLSKYDRLIAEAKQVAAARAIVVHPCDESSLRGAVEAAKIGLISADSRRAGGQDQQRRS